MNETYQCRAVTVEYGAYTACYSKLSGSTHILDAFPGEVVSLICNGVANSEPEIVSRIEQATGERLPPGATKDILDSLVAFGLIDLATL
ncbi:MAG: hypothetical protein Cons2KO_30430 [Congregibacter sp.]